VPLAGGRLLPVPARVGAGLKIGFPSPDSSRQRHCGRHWPLLAPPRASPSLVSRVTAGAASPCSNTVQAAAARRSSSRALAPAPHTPLPFHPCCSRRLVRKPCTATSCAVRVPQPSALQPLLQLHPRAPARARPARWAAPCPHTRLRAPYPSVCASAVRLDPPAPEPSARPPLLRCPAPARRPRAPLRRLPSRTRPPGSCTCAEPHARSRAPIRRRLPRPSPHRAAAAARSRAALARPRAPAWGRPHAVALAPAPLARSRASRLGAPVCCSSSARACPARGGEKKRPGR
jgi:hypothetical protein